MADRYYLWINGRRRGPYGIAQIAELWRAGKIDHYSRMARNAGEFMEADNFWADIKSELDNPTPPPAETSIAAQEMPLTPRRLALPLAFLAIPAIPCLVAVIIYASDTFRATLTHAPDEDSEIIKIARQNVEHAFPRAKIFSSQEDAPLKPHGATCEIPFTVDGTNALGVHIQKQFVVQMYKSGGQWSCTGVREQPEL